MTTFHPLSVMMFSYGVPFPPFSNSMGKGKDEKAGKKYVLPLISQCPNRRYDLRCEGWSLPGVTVSADAGQH